LSGRKIALIISCDALLLFPQVVHENSGELYFTICFFFKLFIRPSVSQAPAVTLGKVSKFVMFNEVADRTIHVRSHERFINVLRENVVK
jgi:hypothetical protein